MESLSDTQGINPTNERIALRDREPMTSWSKHDTIVCLILIALMIVAWLPRFRGPIDLRWDAAVYYILGSSIADGKGYRLLNEPGDIQAIQYPPALPFLVAAHQWGLRSDDPIIVGQWLRRSSFAVFCGFILATYGLLRHYLSLRMAFAGTAICLFHMYTYFMSDLLFPEVLYGLTTIAFLLCSLRGRGRVASAIAAVLGMTAFGLRTIGIALLAAWVIESIFNRNLKQAGIRFAIALVPLLTWQTYIASVVGGTEYGRVAYAYQRATYMFYNVSYANNVFTLKDSFAPEAGAASFPDVAARTFQNVLQIPYSLGEAVSAKREVYELPWKFVHLPFPLSTPWPVDVALLVLGGFVLGGMLLHLIQRQWILPIYVGLSLAAMCLTPWPGQFNRYLMPLAPFLILFMLSALLIASGVVRRGKTGSVTLAGIVISSVLLQQLLNLGVAYARWHQPVTYRDLQGDTIHYRLFFYHDAYRAFDAGLDWLQDHARPPDVLAGSMPHWMYLRTRLKAVMPPFEPDPMKAQALLDSVPVTYLLIDEGLAVDTKRYMGPVVQQFPHRWERVYVDSIAPERPGEPRGEFAIYRRIGLPSAPADMSMPPSERERNTP